MAVGCVLLPFSAFLLHIFLCILGFDWKKVKRLCYQTSILGFFQWKGEVRDDSILTLRRGRVVSGFYARRNINGLMGEVI